MSLLAVLFLFFPGFAQETAIPVTNEIANQCYDGLVNFPGELNKSLLKKACEKVTVLEGCTSVQGTKIFHYDRKGSHKSQQKILVFSLIHGDETGAGTLARLWMERLEDIDPRNSWRVIPMLNPDGVKLKTRTNANKIDLNRNFPTKDWDAKAQDYWIKHTKSNPRRFPGNQAGSEPEINCALKQIDDFKPDFVVSIHTPLKVLDFDGPKVAPPKFDYLPWRSLGHYPGSMGRYLWSERKTPVLTTELREDLPKTSKPLVDLQDVIGQLVSLDFPTLQKK
jgi:protein MpaA